MSNREVIIQGTEVKHPTAKEQAFDRLIRAVEDHRRTVETQIVKNRRVLKEYANQQTVLKRERGVITKQLRQLRADRDALRQG